MGVRDEKATDSTPRTPRIRPSRSENRRSRLSVESCAPARSMSARMTRWRLKPASKSWRLRRLPDSSPAAVTSTRHTAICATTSTFPSVGRRVPWIARAPAFNAGARATRVDFSAGITPKPMPVNSTTAAVSASTCTFTVASIAAGDGPIANTERIAPVPQMATITPAAPPRSASTALSVTQLPHQPRSAGADAEPHSNLACTIRRSRQKENGDVRARDEQQQGHHRHQHPQRFRVPPAQREGPARGRHKRRGSKPLAGWLSRPPVFRFL